MKNHIVCIASEHKGNEFFEEAHERGWRVTLVTRKKLLDEPWPWTVIDDVRSVEDNALPVDYVRAITNVAGTTKAARGASGAGPVRAVTWSFIQPPNASSRRCASAICASGLCVMVMNQTRLKNSDHAVFQ